MCHSLTSQLILLDSTISLFYTLLLSSAAHLVIRALHVIYEWVCMSFACRFKAHPTSMQNSSQFWKILKETRPLSPVHNTRMSIKAKQINGNRNLKQTQKAPHESSIKAKEINGNRKLKQQAW